MVVKPASFSGCYFCSAVVQGWSDRYERSIGHVRHGSLGSRAQSARALPVVAISIMMILSKMLEVNCHLPTPVVRTNRVRAVIGTR